MTRVSSSRPARRAIALQCIAFAALVASTPAAAQRVRGSLDIGAIGIRYADSLNDGAAVLTPRLRIAGRSASLDLSGSAAGLSAGTWSVQGEMSGSAFSPAFGPLRAELAAAAGGSAHQDGTRTGELQGVARLHLMRGGWGVWAGGGGGRAYDGARWRSVVLGDAGAWLRHGAVTVVASVTPAVVDDSTRYTDGDVALRWTGAHVELSGMLGARAGTGIVAATGRGLWGSLSAIYWAAPNVGIVATAGSYPADLTQGFPNGRYVSLALRLALHRTPSTPESPYPPQAEHGAMRFALAGTGPARTVRVYAPRAHRVEIAGDFTSWVPVALARAPDGWWSAPVQVSPGTYQVSVRVDGGAWQVPPGLVPVTDESGTTSGVLVVR